MIAVEARPLSVVVFGSSTGVFVAGTRSEDRPFLTWPIVLDRAVVDGRSFSVDNRCRVAGFVTDIRTAWLSPVSITRPDIVVMNFGAYEAFPRLIPRALTFYMMGARRRGGRLRDIYWYQAGRALNRLSRLAAQVDPFVPTSVGGYVSPKRFEAELRLHCLRIQRQAGSRIVLMDNYGPASSTSIATEKFMQRWEQVNRSIYRVAGELGLEVFPFRQIIADLDPDKVLGDGLHLNAYAHRVVGEKLAELLAGPQS